MKNNKILHTAFILLIIIFISSLTAGNSPEQDKNEINLPAGFEPVIYYDKREGKLYAKGYDNFMHGIDSSLHVININEGENSLYYVLFDMSIEITIIKYKE